MFFNKKSSTSNGKKVVIALGGNALGNSPEEQKELVKIPAQKVAELVQKGYQVLVGHGNGPQVGMIVNAFASAVSVDSKLPPVPFAEAGGMSQGYIGYHMLTAIASEFKAKGINKDVLYFLTQTIVDANDAGFTNPTKPVGPFYKTMDAAKKANPNSVIKEDSGRGFRKVVASPKPIDVLGINTVKKNFNEGALVIVGGGGGIPTIVNGSNYEGRDGVIDKDLALQLIANKVDADTLIVLTAVDTVFVNFNKPDQKALNKTNVAELKKYIGENQFAPGSMLPKVEAAIRFVENNPKGTAIIASLEKLGEAIEGKTGTHITFN